MAGLTGLEVYRRQFGREAEADGIVALRLSDGTLADLASPVPENAACTWIGRESAEGLDILRHDAAHILAQALKELDPDLQVTIGPVIEEGFYYDIARSQPFVADDLAIIEARMHAVVDRALPLVREEWSRARAVDFFRSAGEHFKVEIIEDLPADAVISIYRQGDFVDLCRGPHGIHTGQVGHAFRLTRLAGAYWRGDSSRPMLQRIYGTAWARAEDLQAWNVRQEEAARRDHRKLGRELGLFHMQEEAQGSVFWHPRGWTLYRTLEGYIRQRIQDDGYVEVRTPQLVDRSLWEASGHWEKFRENMFTVTPGAGEDSVLALKPMNCPCHVQIFNQGLKSYRDLPLRMAEFGSCHRNEASGALHGLTRVRAMVQDDAHIFCTPAQIVEESVRFCQLLKKVYSDLGFGNIHVRFSDRPAVRAGQDAVWDQAEAALKQASGAAGLVWELNPGEGAFYGPKLEFVLKDALGRAWQCGTLQMDFVLPERLGATYVGEDGQKHTPVMLHRAVLGSLERFIAILLEHHGGRLPFWLAPVQVVVCPVTTRADDWAGTCAEHLKAAGVRVEQDLRNEKVTLKIREHSLQKIPVLVIVGQREADEGTVTLRTLGQEAQETLTLDAAVARLQHAARIPDSTGARSV
jgi:threonyl-tRNA synthetase